MGGTEKTRSESDTVVPGLPSGDLYPGVVSYPVVRTCACQADTSRYRHAFANMLGEIQARTRCNVEIAQKHSTGNFFLLICPGGNLDCVGFQGREEGAGLMLWLLRGLNHTDGPGPVHMLTEHYMSLSTSRRGAPPECTGAPSGILTIPIQFVGAGATSWMSSVDTSV